MKLFEYITQALSKNLDIFRSKPFINGLEYWKERYYKNEKDSQKRREAVKNLTKEQTESWFDSNPRPEPILLYVTPQNTEDKKAYAAFLLAGLHDEYLDDEIPVVPEDWTADIKEFLNSYIDCFKTDDQKSIDSGNGLEYKNKIQRAVEALKTASVEEPQHIKPIKLSGKWKVKNGSIELLMKIDNDIKRQGIPYNSKTFRQLRDFLKRHCKRPDMADTLYHDKENRRIKTKMSYKTMFSK